MHLGEVITAHALEVPASRSGSLISPGSRGSTTGCWALVGDVSTVSVKDSLVGVVSLRTDCWVSVAEVSARETFSASGCPLLRAGSGGRATDWGVSLGEVSLIDPGSLGFTTACLVEESTRVESEVSARGTGSQT